MPRIMYASFRELLRSFPFSFATIGREIGSTPFAVVKWAETNSVPSWWFAPLVRFAEQVQHPGVTYQVMCELAEKVARERQEAEGRERPASRNRVRADTNPPSQKEPQHV